MNPPCWGSETAVSLNLTIPLQSLTNELRAERDAEKRRIKLYPTTVHGTITASGGDPRAHCTHPATETVGGLTSCA